MNTEAIRLLKDIPQAWVLFCQEQLKAAEEWKEAADKMVEQIQNDT